VKVTKEDLMKAANLSEEQANALLESFDGDFSSDNSPISSLKKALNSDGQQDLFKADDEEVEDEEEEYDADYMKKYMKRYMKENPSSCKRMMEDLGVKKEAMKKASSEIDPNDAGVVVEMADLQPYMESQNEFNESLVKAVSELNSKLDTVIEANAYSQDILEKAAIVTADSSEKLDEFFSKPNTRKGVSFDPLTKAVQPSKEKKMVEQFPKIVHETLMKAISNGNREAGEVIGRFESAGKNFKMLRDSDKFFISNLLQEVK